MKKILCLMVFFAAICLTGCKPQEKICYKAEIHVLGVGSDPVLCEESPNVTLKMGVFPLECPYKAYLNVVTYVGDGKRASVRSYPFKYGYECDIDGVSVDYTVNDRKAAFDLTAFNLTSGGLADGQVNLEKEYGTHTIRYTIPKIEEYDTEAVEYSVTLTFDRDSRNERAIVKIQDDYLQYYSAEETKSYDFYVFDKTPNFRFISEKTSEDIYGSRNESVGYRKMNENTGKVFPTYTQYGLRSDEILPQVDSKGLYLCRVAMSDHSEFCDVEYICYILFV